MMDVALLIIESSSRVLLRSKTLVDVLLIREQLCAGFWGFRWV